MSRAWLFVVPMLLAVAAVGHLGVQDGGVELIDPVTMVSQGFLTREIDLGGDITDVVLVGDHGFVVLTDASFNTSCLRFSRLSGQSTGTVYAPGGFVIQDIELAPSGVLYLADRTPTAPGIRIYEVNTLDEITTAPIDVGRGSTRAVLRRVFRSTRATESSNWR